MIFKINLKVYHNGAMLQSFTRIFIATFFVDQISKGRVWPNKPRVKFAWNTKESIKMSLFEMVTLCNEETLHSDDDGSVL